MKKSGVRVRSRHQASRQLVLSWLSWGLPCGNVPSAFRYDFLNTSSIRAILERSSWTTSQHRLYRLPISRVVLARSNQPAPVMIFTTPRVVLARRNQPAPVKPFNYTMCSFSKKQPTSTSYTFYLYCVVLSRSNQPTSTSYTFYLYCIVLSRSNQPTSMSYTFHLYRVVLSRSNQPVRVIPSTYSV